MLKKIGFKAKKIVLKSSMNQQMDQLVMRKILEIEFPNLETFSINMG